MSYIVQPKRGGGFFKERNASVKPNNSLLDILFNAYKRIVGTVGFSGLRITLKLLVVSS